MISTTGLNAKRLFQIPSPLAGEGRVRGELFQIPSPLAGEGRVRGDKRAYSGHLTLTPSLSHQGRGSYETASKRFDPNRARWFSATTAPPTRLSRRVRRPAARQSQPRGFTLLELILVLVLISAVLALAAPSLRRFARGRETTDAASHLLALTHLARSQAVAQAQVWRLNIDPEAATYWLTVQQAGAFVQPQREYGRLFRFPADVSVTVDGSETSDGMPYVQFYPDGRSDPATIELADPDGKALQVACPTLSERFRIVSLSPEAGP